VWALTGVFVCCHPADRVYSEVKRNARAALLRQIERERDGDMIDRSLLKNILDIFIEVCLWLRQVGLEVEQGCVTRQAVEAATFV
jgi:hypothetical protein